MALGGPVVRQHYVEFIRGTGVKLDGVVDGTSTNGPWTWVVPKDVSTIIVTGVGAGGGGGGSSNAKGGGGAGSGLGVQDLRCAVTPGASLTITIAAGGAGGVGTNGTSGGNTTIESVVISPYDYTTTINLNGGSAGGGAGAAQGASGGSAYNMVVGAEAPGNATTALNGRSGNTIWYLGTENTRFIGAAGSTAGGLSSVGSNPGGDGGVHPSVAYIYSQMAYAAVGGIGDTTGTVSRSGGGAGAPSMLGYGGAGGDPTINGGNGTGYGAGGGGSGGVSTGSTTGGDGAPGYVGIFYWSAD
jgi:hypothetical protein